MLAALMAVAAAGCVSKTKAKRQAAQAFAAGQAQAMQQAPQQQSQVVTISGQVRNHVIPWQEGLTLSQAIDAAVYTGFTDPHGIRLTRGQESVEISVKELLSGRVNPELEAGDLIEIRR